MLPRGTVLVVGGGNTGSRSPSELSSTHNVAFCSRLAADALASEAAGSRPLLVARKVAPARDKRPIRIGRRLRERETLNRPQTPGRSESTAPS